MTGRVRPPHVSGFRTDVHRTPSRLHVWQIGLILLLAWPIAAFVLLVLVAYALTVCFLHLALWITWVPRGKRVLFVYSNSPVWQPYVEENILPRLPKGSVVLNWSERRNWNRWALSSLTFRTFGGRKNFNPLAVVVRPLRGVRVFRFWQAFREYKHGRDASLKRLEHDLFSLLRVSGQT